MVAREHSKEAFEVLVDMVAVIHTSLTHYTFGGVAGKALVIFVVPYDMERWVVSDLVKILGKLIVNPSIFDTVELQPSLHWTKSC